MAFKPRLTQAPAVLSSVTESVCAGETSFRPLPPRLQFDAKIHYARINFFRALYLARFSMENSKNGKIKSDRRAVTFLEFNRLSARILFSARTWIVPADASELGVVSFFNVVYLLHRRVAKRNASLIIDVGYRKVSFSDYFHAKDETKLSCFLTLSHDNSGDRNSVRQIHVHQIGRLETRSTKVIDYVTTGGD